MQAARKETFPLSNAPMAHHENKAMPYYMLLGMIAAHFIVMYALMYLMVDRFTNVFLNINNFYMSGAMAAPMAILMLVFMKDMYRSRELNYVVMGISALLLFGFIFFTRSQSFVGDEQFIKSMIPHHSGAILMCNKAGITDAELKSLCGKIVQSQQEEVNQMKAILSRLQR